MDSSLSVLDQQRLYYRGTIKNDDQEDDTLGVSEATSTTNSRAVALRLPKLPPMYPHGNDKNAVPSLLEQQQQVYTSNDGTTTIIKRRRKWSELRQRRDEKRRKLQKDAEMTTTTTTTTAAAKSKTTDSIKTAAAAAAPPPPVKTPPQQLPPKTTGTTAVSSTSTTKDVIQGEVNDKSAFVVDETGVVDEKGAVNETTAVSESTAVDTTKTGDETTAADGESKIGSSGSIEKDDDDDDIAEVIAALPASQIPEGFPEEYMFRALAIYATIRSLSIPLRISPFTPTTFLRALYLSIPNNVLLGTIHVHILRILLHSLEMGYNFKDNARNNNSTSNVASNVFDVVKKRKLDHIKWTLRGGDNLNLLNFMTWPIFYDDYCHLTADVHYAAIFDIQDHVDIRFLSLHDIIDIKANDNETNDDNNKNVTKGINTKNNHNKKSKYRTDDFDYEIVVVDSDDEEEYKLDDDPAAVIDEEDDEFIYDDDDESYGGSSKKRKKPPKKTITKTKQQDHRKLKSSSSGPPTKKQQQQQPPPTSEGSAPNPTKTTLATKLDRIQQHQQQQILQRQQLLLQQQLAKNRSTGVAQHNPNNMIQPSRLPQRQQQQQLHVPPPPNGTTLYRPPHPSNPHFATQQQQHKHQYEMMMRMQHQQRQQLQQLQQQHQPQKQKYAIYHPSQFYHPMMQHHQHHPQQHDPYTSQFTSDYWSSTETDVNNTIHDETDQNEHHPPTESHQYHHPYHNPQTHQASSEEQEHEHPDSVLPTYHATSAQNHQCLDDQLDEEAIIVYDVDDNRMMHQDYFTDTPNKLDANHNVKGQEVIDLTSPDHNEFKDSVSEQRQQIQHSLDKDHHDRISHVDELLNTSELQSNVPNIKYTDTHPVNLYRPSGPPRDIEHHIQFHNQIYHEGYAPPHYSNIQRQQPQTVFYNSDRPIYSETSKQPSPLRRPPDFFTQLQLIPPHHQQQQHFYSNFQPPTPLRRSESNIGKKSVDDDQDGGNKLDNAVPEERRNSLTHIDSSVMTNIDTSPLVSPRRCPNSPTNQEAMVPSVDQSTSLDKAEPVTREFSSVSSNVLVGQQTLKGMNTEKSTIQSICSKSLRISFRTTTTEGIKKSDTQVPTIHSTLQRDKNPKYYDVEITSRSLGEKNSFDTSIALQPGRSYDSDHVSIVPSHSAPCKTIDTFPTTQLDNTSLDIYPHETSSMPSEKENTTGPLETTNLKMPTADLQSKPIDSDEEIVREAEPEMSITSQDSRNILPSIIAGNFKVQQKKSQDGINVPSCSDQRSIDIFHITQLDNTLLDKLPHQESSVTLVKEKTNSPLDTMNCVLKMPTDDLQSKPIDKACNIVNQAELNDSRKVVPSILANNITVQPEQSQNIDSNIAAMQLKAFIRKQQKAPNITLTKNETTDVDFTHDNDVVFPVDEVHHWSHFDPLKNMRMGTPYHELSLEEKLIVLEYLIDELLTVDWIAAELSARHKSTDHFEYLYGPKPQKCELKFIKDADGDQHDEACNVCNEIGNVVCCDSCVSVYHAKCVGYLNASYLPDVWFCPECCVKDPSAFGPLRGGKKSEVNRFFIKDLMTANARIYDNSWQDSNIKLLVVHGFVFCQDATLAPVDGVKTFTLNRAFEKVQSPLKVKDILTSLGSHWASQWPINQIPIVSAKKWNLEVESTTKYFQSRESFDPSAYRNQYAGAPILLEGIRRSKESYLMEERILNDVPTSVNITDLITDDFSNDTQVYKSISYGATLDALRFITTYLLYMENELSKASLLDEFWKIRDMTLPKSWRQSVSYCRSIRQLSRLILLLVDSTHHRAFLKSWTQSTIVKGKENINTCTIVEHGVVISNEYTPRDEIVRRYWTRSQMCHLPTLLLKTAKYFRTIGQKSVPASSTGAKKRKNSIQRAGPFHSENIEISEGDGNVVEKLRSRRSSDNASPFSNDRIQGWMPLNMSILDSNIRSRVDQYLRESKQILQREPHWPIAGKKLFDPLGYMPSAMVRYLGRNGGALFAPFMDYTTVHEVGQVAFFHVWRKRVTFCTQYEQLVELVQILDMHFNHSCIKKCPDLMQRKIAARGKNLYDINCTQRDMIRGVDYHLCGLPGNKSNHWESSTEIDLTTLCLEREKRSKRHVLNLKKRLQAEKVAAKLKLEAETKASASAKKKLPEIKSTLLAPVLEQQEVTKEAAKIISAHIEETRKVHQKYESKFTADHLVSLRKITDDKLMQVFAKGRLDVNPERRMEMMLKAEDVVHKDRQITQVASVSKAPTVLAVEAHTNQIESSPSESITLDRSDVGAPSYDLQRIKMTGTPLDWSRRILQYHKDYTRSVYVKYGHGLFPATVLDGSRRLCEDNLRKVMEDAGIRTAPHSTSLLIKEAEKEVQAEVLESMNPAVAYNQSQVTSQQLHKAVNYGGSITPTQNNLHQASMPNMNITNTSQNGTMGTTTPPISWHIQQLKGNSVDIPALHQNQQPYYQTHSLSTIPTQSHLQQQYNSLSLPMSTINRDSYQNMNLSQQNQYMTSQSQANAIPSTSTPSFNIRSALGSGNYSNALALQQQQLQQQLLMSNTSPYQQFNNNGIPLQQQQQQQQQQQPQSSINNHLWSLTYQQNNSAASPTILSNNITDWYHHHNNRS